MIGILKSGIPVCAVATTGRPVCAVATTGRPVCAVAATGRDLLSHLILTIFALLRLL